MADVFLSYASEDRDRLEPLASAVEKLGFSVWWDREIDPGTSFENAIETQLSSARIVVVVWSANSVRSAWVHSEAMEGLERGVLVPVVFEKVRLPLAFRHLNTANLIDWNGDPDAAEFRRFVRSLEKVQSGETLTTEPLGEHRTSPARSSARPLIYGLSAVAALVLLAGIYLQTTDSQRAGNSAIPDNSIAVLDFENSGAADTNYIATGISDQVRDLLTRSPMVQVASRTLSAAALNSSSNTNRVRFFLEGSSLATEESLQLNVHLVDSNNGFRIWSQRFSVPRAQMLDASIDIVHAVVDQMNLPVSIDPASTIQYKPTSNADAFDAYLRGAELLKSPPSEAILEQAERAFNAAIQQDAGFAMPYAGLCQIHLIRYRLVRGADWFDSARENCHRALELDTYHTQAHRALGNLYITSGDYLEAKDAFSAAINISPSDPEIASGLAKSFSFLGQADRAEQWYRRAISMDPDFWISHTELGAFFFGQAEYDKAIVSYKKAIEINPEYAPGWANLSATYQLAGELQDAFLAAEKSLSLERTGTALSNAATASYFIGRFEDARAMYKQAVELSPKNHLVWGNLGEVELLLGELSTVNTFNTAIQLARADLQINLTDVVTLGRLASYLAAVEPTSPEVDELLTSAYKLQKDDPYLHYDAALAHLRQGETARARNDIETAIELGYPKILAEADPQLEGIVSPP